jgi:hypothetical protein
MKRLVQYSYSSLLLCLLIIPNVTRAEDLTITTYYPSPFGSYDQLTTANSTFLATAAGMVGIGNTAPTEKLDVTGNIRASGSISGNTVGSTDYFNGPGIVRNIQHVTGTTNIQTSSSTYSNMTGMSITMNTQKSVLLILWNAGIANENDNPASGAAGGARLRVTVDGNQVGTYQYGSYVWEGGVQHIVVDCLGGNAITAVNPGTHTIQLQWLSVRGDTIYSWPIHPDGYGRSMTVMEIQQP